jgi:hypothetical protein
MSRGALSGLARSWRNLTMNRGSSRSDHRDMDGKRRTATRALFAIGLVASLGIPSTAATAAPPGYDLVKSERVLAGSSASQFEICVDDRVRTGAFIVIAETYRNQQGREQVLSRFTGQAETVKAVTSNRNVVSVSPATWRQGRGWRGGRAPFVVTGLGQGTATVTFSDGRAIAAPFPMTFVVRECHYEISLSSTWHINVGFRPVAHQAVTNLRLDPDGGINTYSATASARNQATAPNYGDCTVTYSVPTTLVTVKATEDATRPDRLQLDITYQPIPDVAPLVCHVPYGVYTGSGAGKVRPIRLSITLVNKMSERFLPNHILDANGEWPGLTRITVRKVVS